MPDESNSYLHIFCLFEKIYTKVSLTWNLLKFVNSLTESFCICLLTSQAYMQYLSRQFFWEDFFWEDFFGGFFGLTIGRNSLLTFELTCLLRFWFLSRFWDNEEGRKVSILRSAIASTYIAIKNLMHICFSLSTMVIL